MIDGRCPGWPTGETCRLWFNLEGETGMLIMPFTLDLRFWRWKLTVRLARIS
jgi:hypothetical protein